ncbi:transmembrane protein 116 isoform X2 [Pristis pectinata]|uniref:transmembrane protein 116 isoform X2 n=1 Tax=Pristis pectinata TaxID=685728 RepID=UPI00223D6A19|nr:transmembrane protein 116 isoform X2 [Pristis pectinata]
MEQLTLAQGGAFGVWANSSGADGNWTEFLTALRWIQFSMVTLSIVGSGSIIGYTALQQLLQHPEIRPLFYLSLTDLMLGLCWLIGVLFHGESFTARNVTCYNLQVMGQVLYISSFCYTLNYIWCLFSDLRTRIYTMVHSPSHLVTEQSVRLNMILIILSSLIPVVLMVPVFCVGNIYGCYANYSSSCLLLHTGPSKLNDSYIVDHKSACHIIYLYSTITFLITFFFTLLGLVILLTKMRFRYMKLVTLTRFLGDQQWAMIRVIEWRVFLYPAALLFCWGPASILATVKLLNPMNMSRLYFVLYILQALTAPSQGLLNCIVYGWTQRMFRYMKQKAYCDADTQTPLLRFQKQSYHSTRSANVINQLPISPTT